MKCFHWEAGLLATTVFIMGLPSGLAAHPNQKNEWSPSARIGLSFNYAKNTTQQFNICMMGIPLTQRLIVESPVIGFSYIDDSPYSAKCDYSLLPVATIMAPMAIMADSSLANSAIGKRAALGLAGIHCALNSTIYYTATGNLMDARESNTHQVIVSPFIKNETDWFFTRSHDWLQVSPGAGIRIYVGKAAGVNLSLGYQRSFRSDFKGHWVKRDMAFMNVGFDVDFDAGMSV